MTLDGLVPCARFAWCDGHQPGADIDVDGCSGRVAMVEGVPLHVEWSRGGGASFLFGLGDVEWATSSLDAEVAALHALVDALHARAVDVAGEVAR